MAASESVNAIYIVNGIKLERILLRLECLNLLLKNII